jgi:hypothetical protein
MGICVIKCYDTSIKGNLLAHDSYYQIAVGNQLFDAGRSGRIILPSELSLTFREALIR